jgi:excisionase family DNA binding protein
MVSPVKGKSTTDDAEFIYFPLLTVSEAAKYLGVGKRIVYHLIELDEIRAVKERRALLVEKKSLDAFREGGKLT